jgi:hypothetical protein
MELSVLIPARNEMFLRRTVEDVLEHAQAETEVVVILDGTWADPPLALHPRVTVVHLAESIGQRAATNLAARLARGRYVMKLDAHCSLAPGFDVALIEAAKELGPDVTQVPAQYNLHAFDWVCQGCGASQYQGPTPGPCVTCKGAFERRVVWKPRKSRLTTSWRFDTDLHFQYWREHEKRQEGDLPETLSCLGACWFMERARYFALGGLDEGHGSWGQMGTEIGCKSWLSGGRMVTNKRTWFAHLFRTQGGDFGFPYPMSHTAQEHARDYSRRLWLNDAWPGQVRPLSWLIDHFAPVPGWAEAQAAPTMAPGSVATPRPRTKGIVYYSDMRLAPDIARLARLRLAGIVDVTDMPMVAVVLGPLSWRWVHCIQMQAERGILTMFRQILRGLRALDTDYAFLCEHDVLYDRSHFDVTPPRDDRFYYNENVWKIDATDLTRPALHYPVKQTSGLCASRGLLIEHYRKRIERVGREGRYDRRIGFEPGTHAYPRGIDNHPADGWMSKLPNVDVRHGQNLTPSRWRKDQFRDQRYTAGWTEAAEVPGWGTPAMILGAG